MRTPSPHEELARDRRRFERLLLARMGTAITREDAEDIVSEALLRAQCKLETDPPQRGAEVAWFARIVVNHGIDYLRARDGRPRNGDSARPRPVAFDDLRDEAPLGTEEPAELTISELGERTEREQARQLVQRVMETLDPKDAELVKLKHLTASHATRIEVAAMAGMTLGQFRHQYALAWSRFVDAVALEAPTERCQRTRQLLGELDAGTAPSEVAHEIDAHTIDCASCRVFARESYRALELMPFVPVLGVAERWSQRIAIWWDRTGPEAAAGAGTAAAGAGFWAMIASGGPIAMVKAVALVCTATAVTAGLCAGVVSVVNDLEAPPAKTDTRRSDGDEPKRRSAPTPTPMPTVVAATPAPTRTPVPRRRPKPRPTPEPQPTASAADTSGASEIPATAPPGASEFSPSVSSVNNNPAPVPDAGGGEFSP